MERIHHLEAIFPNLSVEAYLVTSVATPEYNCIGWAVEDARFWWPTAPAYAPYYWPPEVSQDESIESFVEAFRTVGYELCGVGDLDPAYEKVVLYVQGGTPTHAARQLPTGEWTSKLGQLEDITHARVASVEGSLYGEAMLYFQRSR